MKNIVFLFKKIRSLFEKIISPKSKSEDSQRREFILNVLLLGLITLSVIASGITIVQSVTLETYRGLSPLVATMVLLGFVFLYFLSRKGFSHIASYLFLVAFFLPVSYTVYKWGPDLPAASLSYAVVIIMAGILINTRLSFVTTIFIILLISLIGYANYIDLLKIDNYWRNEAWHFADITVIFVLFFIIAVVSWLSNREIEKSLARARRSEADLKKERDSLEVTVEKKTKELKETQAEKMAHLYRFAEFGRLSSGLFHDLINPLTAVSLNLEKGYVAKAVRVAKKLEDLVAAVRKQLSRQETKTLFSVNEEITQALEVLSYKAKKSGVAIRLFSRQEIKTYGNAVKFNQVALNLVDNAIDSHTQTVTMSLSQEGNTIIFEVKDKGVGISEENKSKLFEPFFTTKEGQGIGIGLSMIKRIIEKDFNGSIEVASKEGEGSVFTVKFPRKQNE